MSQESPFSQPTYESPPPPRPGIGTTSVIAICITMLLMCGGVLTFAFMAIERLAEVIEEVDIDGDYEDDDTVTALEYALGDVDEVDQEIGTISTIEVNSNLTYDIKGDNPEYYYDVTGDRGTMVVAVWFDEDEESERWFERVARVTEAGELIEKLSVRSVPFDSQMSMDVWQRLATCPEMMEEIGEIEYVAADWESDVEAADDEDEIAYIFDVRGSDGSARVKTRYADWSLDQINSIVRVGDDGTETPLTLGHSNGVSDPAPVTDAGSASRE
jgi:hypothetical protein